MHASRQQNMMVSCALSVACQQDWQREKKDWPRERLLDHNTHELATGMVLVQIRSMHVKMLLDQIVRRNRRKRYERSSRHAYII
jgi:hypothetical protein